MITGLNLKINDLEHQGFTLMEVLFAMLIGTMGLLGVALMQGNAIEGNRISNKYAQATFLAQDALEHIKLGNGADDGAFGFIDMSQAAPGGVKAFGEVAGINENGDPGGLFNMTWQISTHTDWSRKLLVNVSWHSSSGRTRNVNLASVSRGDGN